jgi:hypothetical protein
LNCNRASGASVTAVPSTNSKLGLGSSALPLVVAAEFVLEVLSWANAGMPQSTYVSIMNAAQIRYSRLRWPPARFKVAFMQPSH